MSTFLLLTVVFTCVWTSPIGPATPQDANTTSQLDPVEEALQKDLEAVSYIQDFKNAMTDYVRSQYSNLTLREVEAVQATVEDFLINFGRDLRDVLEHQSAPVGEKPEEVAAKVEAEAKAIEDGLSDSQFEDVKARIKEQFPQISEASASEIVFRLRRNLLATRQKLDGIITDSRKAHEMYSY